MCTWLSIYLAILSTHAWWYAVRQVKQAECRFQSNFSPPSSKKSRHCVRSMLLALHRWSTRSFVPHKVWRSIIFKNLPSVILGGGQCIWIPPFPAIHVSMWFLLVAGRKSNCDPMLWHEAGLVGTLLGYALHYPFAYPIVTHIVRLYNLVALKYHVILSHLLSDCYRSPPKKSSLLSKESVSCQNHLGLLPRSSRRVVWCTWLVGFLPPFLYLGCCQLLNGIPGSMRGCGTQ